jgi:hypothetical protein
MINQALHQVGKSRPRFAPGSTVAPMQRVEPAPGQAAAEQILEPVDSGSLAHVQLETDSGRFRKQNLRNQSLAQT